MDLDRLKNIWIEHHQAHDKTESVNLSLLREASVNKIKGMLSDFKWTTLFELAVTIIGVNYLIGYLFDLIDELKFFVPGLAILVLGLYDIIWKLWMLAIYSRIDYQSAITETQKRVEKLRYYQRREINELYLIIPLFWMAFIVVIARGLLGVDAYQFIILNWPFQLIGSIVVAIIVVWFVKLFPDKKLNQAATFLKEIEEFERNP